MLRSYDSATRFVKGVFYLMFPPQATSSGCALLYLSGPSSPRQTIEFLPFFDSHRKNQSGRPDPVV